MKTKKRNASQRVRPETAQLAPASHADLLQLSELQLTQYLTTRLRGESIAPPLDTRAHEDPEDIVMRAWADANHAGSFPKVVEDFLAAKCWEAGRSVDSAELLSRTLYLVAKLQITAARPFLVALLASDGATTKGLPSLYYNDIFLQVLATLQHLEVGNEFQELWAKHLTDPKYAAAAYAGIIRHGLNPAIRHFPALLATAEVYPNEVPLRDLLVNLYNRYKNQNLVHVLYLACATLSTNRRQLLHNTFLSIPSARSTATADSPLLNLTPPEHNGASIQTPVIDYVKMVREFTYSRDASSAMQTTLCLTR